MQNRIFFQPLEEVYQELIDGAPEAVVVLDLELGTYVGINQKAIDLFGYSRDEFEQMGPLDMSPEVVFGQDAKFITKGYITDALNGGNPVFDWIHIGKNGIQIPCEVRLTRLFPLSRKLVKASLIDMRGGRKESWGLRESEERLRLALHVNKLGCFDWFPAEGKLHWDRRMYEIFGLDPGLGLDNNEYFMSVIHPLDKDTFIEKISSLMSKENGKEYFEDEYRILIGTEIRHLSVLGKILRTENGEVKRVLGTCFDSTETKADKEKAIEFHARWKSIAENPFDWLAIVDRDGIFQYINHTAPGTVEEDLLFKKTIFDFIPENEHNSIRAEIALVFQTGRSGYYESYIPSINQWTSNHIGPIMKDGTVDLVSIMTRNITHQKEAVRELRETRWILEEAERISNMGSWDWNIKTNQIFWSDQLFRIYGRKRVDGVPPIESYPEHVHPDDWQAMEENIQMAMRGENPPPLDYRIRRYGDGKERTLRIKSEIFFNELGEPDRLIGSIQDITDRKRIENALMDSEQRFRLVFDQQFQFMLILSPDGKVESINNHFLETTGAQKADYLGNYFWEGPAWRHKPSWQELIQERIETVISKQETLLVEGPFSDAHGNERLSLTAYTPIYSAEGTLRHILVEAKDITDQKQAEKALKISEEKFSKTFFQSPTPMMLVDLETLTALAINKAQTILTGYSEEEIIHIPGKLGLTLRNAGNEHKIHEAVEQIKRGEQLSGFEVTGETKYGCVYHGKVYTEPFEINGKTLHIVSTIDVSEAKFAEKNLREKEEKYRTLFELAGDAILTVQPPEGRIIEANEAASQMLGYSKRELKTMNVLQLIESETKLQTCQSIENQLSHKDIFSLETQFVRKDDRVLPVSISGRSLEIRGTDYCQWICRDITERKLSEQRLERAFHQIKNLQEQLQAENVYLKEEIALQSNFEDMVFTSDGFQKVLSDLEMVAPLDTSVLLLGETGTGKELVARAIHNLSPRSDRTMIKINCGAIPRELVESELFGYEKGAFTGAVGSKAGRFELADKGTLFLDEIGEMPMNVQVKLLRVLQEGEFERLGSTKTTKVDVRIIAATNRNLEEEIQKGNFRQDLYYRLKVFPLSIPPLRERPEDIPILVEHFVNKYGAKHGKTIQFISNDAMNYLREYSWPGNVRELENLIERSIILSQEQTLLIPNVGLKGKTRSIKPSSLTLEEVNRQHILKVLKQCEWKIEGEDGAAAILDIKPSTLRDRMKKLGIIRPR